jgi:ABC-2 type transport system ATP-binding protein
MISIRQLTKRYGDKLAVDNITLDIPQGQLVGYLGPNGAGKSTTIKILTGMLRPTSGSAHVHGLDTMADNLAVKQIIGFVPDSGAVFETLTGWEYVEMVGRLHSLDDSVILQRASLFAEFFELPMETMRNERLAGYSKGMRQKVVIIAALIHNPRVVFFDEPLNGLDANIATMFKELIRHLVRDGKTVLFSSHILDVVERMCDRIIVINAGRIVADGSLATLQQQTGEGSLERIFSILTGGTDLEGRAAAFSRSLSMP